LATPDFLKGHGLEYVMGTLRCGSRTGMTLAHLFDFAFMRNAFVAGTMVAILAGAIGYFVVLRGVTFAAHALSHIGFAGATGAIVLGLPAIGGLLAFSLGGSAAIGILGERLRGRDVAIGVVLAWTLGLGVLFLSLYTGYATEAYALLFGAILGIGTETIIITAGTALLAIAVLVFLYRPLLFSSIDADSAEARGVPIRGIGIVFLLLLGAAVSVAAQVVGILLVFALLVSPAATAAFISDRPGTAIGWSIFLALVFTWGGLILAYLWPYPPSFFITSLAFATYVGVRAARSLRTHRAAAASSRTMHAQLDDRSAV
jgi:zinc/manganese transport system permease protein